MEYYSLTNYHSLFNFILLEHKKYRLCDAEMNYFSPSLGYSQRERKTIVL